MKAWHRMLAADGRAAVGTLVCIHGALKVEPSSSLESVPVLGWWEVSSLLRE